MAGLNSWTLPGNGILGGVMLNLGPSRSGDANSEPEDLLAKALREATERQLPGEAERLGTVAEQIRRNSIPSAMVNPLALPTADLIDWFRRPPEPQQMPQKRTIAARPYFVVDPGAANAAIGRAIIDHYAEYFDPYTKDEQGRRIIDTPAAYTPNAAGKVPPTRKPEWWPLVGIADMASNFIPVGAAVKAMTVGGRAGVAASRVAAAEAGMTGKLLNAIREGRLAELAGEGAGAAGGGVHSNAVSAMGEPNGYHLLGGADGRIFRGGDQTVKNLTPRPVDDENLSFRDSLSNSYPLPPGQRPALAPGRKYMEFDSSKFPPGSAIFDHDPPGHVGVRGVSPEQLMDLVIKKGKFPR